MKATRSRFARLGVSAVAVVLLGGCTTYRFKVDAINAAAGDTDVVSFRVESANPEYARGDRLFETVAGYVKTALSSKGMFEAPRGVRADMIVEIDFGSEAPRFIEAWDWTGPDDMAGRLVSVALFDKYLRITARENAPNLRTHPSHELWSVYVTTESYDEDLVRYLPLLVSAAMDSVGTDTNGPRRIVLRANDDRVLFVKAGM